MKNLIIRLPFILFFMVTSFITIETKACNLPDSVPKGWGASYSYQSDVIIGIDTVIKHSGKASAFIERDPSPSDGTWFIYQSIAADIYRNKRVRFSVYVKSKEAEYVNLWFKAEGSEYVLAFANNFTLNTPIEGTTDWTMYHITLDIPQESIMVQFGVMLCGQGKLWADDCKLEIVDNSVPSDDVVVKGLAPNVKLPKKTNPSYPIATNLGFEDY